MPGPQSSAADPAPLNAEEATAVNELKAILPEGWIVTRVVPRTVPEEWLSESSTGLRIEGRKGPDGFTTWFLPRDWIGIRRPNPSRPRPNYWDGILAGAKYTTITVSTEATIPDLLRRLRLSTPSIVNSGFAEDERVWKGRFDAAEATAARLFTAHCQDEAARDEAAYSLVVLGIPAAPVFRHTAQKGGGEGRSMSISALGYFPGEATTAVIAALLRDPALSDRDRGYAAQVAGKLGAPELGAPLLHALGLGQDVDTRAKIIDGLAHLHHTPAGPVVQKAMEDTDNAYYKAEFAEALAILGYRPAEPAIRALAEAPVLGGKGSWSKDAEESIRQKARLALIRLTGDWGAPSDGVRFLLTAPKEAQLGGPIVAVLYVENVSRKVQSYFDAIGGKFLIDEVAHERRMGAVDGADSLFPTAMWDTKEDLAQWIKAPGTYRVRYEQGQGKSNTVTVVVKKAHP